MGAKDYQKCVAGGRRGFGISAASVLAFAALPCTAGTLGRPPDLVGFAYALRSGVCPVRRRARRTASALPGEMLVHHGCSGLLGGGSVTVRRMRAFAMKNEIGWDGVPMAVATAFNNSSAASLPGMPL